jgi:uncharacterized RDD family membrane protein YckC
MRLSRRFVALGVDFLPMLPATIIQAVTARPDGSSALSDAANNGTPLGYLVFGAIWVVWLLNFAWTCRTGRSVGKALLGGRVVDVRTGAPIGAWRSIGRNLLLWYSGGLVAAASLFRPDRRGWQDLAVKAIVIQEARPPLPQR